MPFFFTTCTVTRTLRWCLRCAMKYSGILFGPKSSWVMPPKKFLPGWSKYKIEISVVQFRTLGPRYPRGSARVFSVACIRWTCLDQCLPLFFFHSYLLSFFYPSNSQILLIFWWSASLFSWFLFFPFCCTIGWINPEQSLYSFSNICKVANNIFLPGSPFCPGACNVLR